VTQEGTITQNRAKRNDKVPTGTKSYQPQISVPTESKRGRNQAATTQRLKPTTQAIIQYSNYGINTTTSTGKETNWHYRATEGSKGLASLVPNGTSVPKHIR
jgi:hypothetical protein